MGVRVIEYEYCKFYENNIINKNINKGGGMKILMFLYIVGIN